MVTYYAYDKQPRSLKYRFIVVNCKYDYVFLLGILFFAQPQQLCGNDIYYAHINFRTDKNFRQSHRNLTAITC